MDQRATVPLGGEDIKRLCGDIADWKVAEILATNAGLNDLEVALSWAAGESDVMGEERKPLSEPSARIFDILTADEVPPDEE